MEAPNITSAGRYESFEGSFAAIAAIEHAIFLGQVLSTFGSFALTGRSRACAHTVI